MKPLAGRRIALPAGRAPEALAAVFREEGATAVSCPLFAVVDAPDPGPVDTFLRALAVGAFDDLILLTGEGLRRLLARAQRIGRAKAVRAALGRVRKVTRGPKPALALHELGLAPDLPASLPTTEGIIETLALGPLRGRRIGVQLSGDAPNEALLAFLARSGAAVQVVAPYRYVVEEAGVRALIDCLGGEEVDAVAFTSAVQVRCLYQGAAALGLTGELQRGLADVVVAAVGPTTAACLRAHGIEPQVTPRPFVVRRLAATVAAALGSDPRLQVEAGGRLRGRRIAIPEHRELDRLAKMLEEEGATTLRCPLMAIFDAPDRGPIDEWLRALAAGRFADVIFFTGEGVRRLLESADRLGLRDQVVAALQRARKITRGPKPARALHELGIRTDLPSSAPTTAGVIEVLRAEGLEGRTVGVQLYGEDPNGTLVDFLLAKGAVVRPVAPYRYAPATHDEKVAILIEDLSAGLVDGIAFTTAVQVERLFQVARRRDSEAALRRGLGRVHVAAVGPVVIEAMQRLGLRADAVPARGFFMRRLTQEMAARLGPKVT